MLFSNVLFNLTEDLYPQMLCLGDITGTVRLIRFVSVNLLIFLPRSVQLVSMLVNALLGLRVNAFFLGNRRSELYQIYQYLKG
jgi:hypothetical protein